MSFLGDLLIRLRAETGDFQQDMGKAAASAERSMRQIESAAAKLGATLSAGGFVLLAKHSIDAADHLFQLNRTTDVAVEQLAGLGIAAKQSGGDLDSVAVSINKLSVNIGKTPEKFKALGVSAKDPLEALKQLADVFVSIKDPQLRAAVAAEALGKSWGGTAPLLAQGGAKIGEMVEKGSKLSGITEEMTKQANEFNDKMVLLTGTGGLMTRMVGPALPLLNMLADGMLNAQGRAQGLNSGMSPLLETLKVLVVVGSDVSFVFDTMGKDMARAAENVRLIAKGDFAGSRALGEQFRKDAAEARAALNAYQATIMGLGKPGAIPAAPGAAGAGNAGAANAAAAAAAAAKAKAFLANNEAEMKRYVSSLKTLEMELATLNGLSAQQRMQLELYGTNMTLADGKTIHLEGSLEKLTAGHKKNLIEVSKLIDARKQLIQRIELGLPAMQAEFDAIERGGEILRDYNQQNVANNEQLRFQIGLLGRTSAEQEKMNALHQIDVEVLRRTRDLAQAYGDDEEGRAKAQAQLEKQAEQQRKDAIKGIEERRKVERDWATGTKDAFNDYIDHATNAAEQARMLFGNAFHNMEDALVDFVKTGKLDFKSLADSIITDIIRISIRAQMAQVIGGGPGGGIGGAIASFLGTPAAPASGAGVWFADGGRPPVGQTSWVGERGPELFVPDVAGAIVPNHALGGAGGPNVYIDARGADSAAVARLEAQVVRLSGTFERRSVSAHVDAARRGVRA